MSLTAKSSDFILLASCLLWQFRAASPCSLSAYIKLFLGPGAGPSADNEFRTWALCFSAISKFQPGSLQMIPFRRPLDDDLCVAVVFCAITPQLDAANGWRWLATGLAPPPRANG